MSPYSHSTSREVKNYDFTMILRLSTQVNINESQLIKTTNIKKNVKWDLLNINFNSRDSV
jgi:hypothetical protein